MIGRRWLLGLATAVALPGAGRAQPRAPAAPPTVRGDITPQQFGARGGHAEADARGWNLAVEEAGRTGRPVVARGTFLLRAPAAAHWRWANKADAPAHVAVQLRSGVTIHGDSTILVAPPARAPASRLERHFLFGTALNTRPGTLTDIVIDGLTFDFHEEFGRIHPFTYAIGVTGVDRLQRRNLTIRSGGTRAGRGLLAENTRGRSDTDIRHDNIVQGTYSRYEQGVTMRRIRFDGFNEALDFDGPCWDVVLDDMLFRNGAREAQCIDTGGGARWQVTNIVAENTGPIIYIYIKGNAWPTYDSWLRSDDRFTESYVPPERMLVRGVRGRNAGWDGRKGEAALIGVYRNRTWLRRQPVGASPRDITLEDWDLQGGGPIAVHDCERVRLHRIRMDGTRSQNDAEAGAALVLREPPVDAGGAVTGRVSDIVISNARGMGMSVVAGPSLEISDVVVQGFGLDAAPLARAGIRLRPRVGAADPPRLVRARVSGSASGGVDVDADGSRDAPRPTAQEERRRHRLEREARP